MIETIIYNEPTIMRLVTPFANIYMAFWEQMVMFFHQALYNPQNEMLAFCKTKCSIRKTKRILLRIPS